MIERIPARDGYGKALMELAEKRKDVIVLDADVSKSTRTNWVEGKSPEHFLNMGISEQDMVGTASGLSLGGMIPFVATYGVFLSGRAWDQIRTTVCYNNLNVKFGGAHAGISVGPDGATHQALEDMAIMRVLPNMKLIAPCDAIETKKATLAAANIEGPVYIRFGREAIPVITDEDTPFIFGKANVLKDGTDVAIIACGAMVYEALEAEKTLKEKGISAMVINLHTIKPIDTETILMAAKKCGCIVTAEEHQMAGGMGSAVSEVLSQDCPTPMKMVGVKDTFGESGEPQELMDKYGLNADAIVSAALSVLKKKAK
jgi:transketolase